MSEDLLKSFQEAYRNLELLPLLEPKDLDRFRVDYGEAEPLLVQALELRKLQIPRALQRSRTVVLASFRDS